MRAASIIAVLAVAATATAEPLASAVGAGAARGLPADLAVVDVHVPAAIARRSPDVDPATVAIEWPRAPRPGRVSVRVAVAGRRLGLATVTVAARAEVLTATRALPVGHLIAADDVIATRQVLTAGVRPAAVAVGAVTTVALDAGAIIAADAITRPPPVARDSALDVIVTAGAITIRARGRLAASARPGEPATVRLDDGDRQLRGTLVDDHTLVVAEETP